MHEILHVLGHTAIETLRILPFLFITYLVMEYIEHKTSEKSKNIIQKAGKFGPVLGAIVGIFPQCGFSVSATNLYAARVITLGTLISVYLATSDEMLPILLTEAVPVTTIITILCLKLIIGMIAGFIIDVVIRIIKKDNQEEQKIEELCEHEHCHCEDGILKSAVRHTLQIFFFLFLITIVLNMGVEVIGEEKIADFILNKPMLGPVMAGIIGLIPNCASSVVITQMFLDGLMSFGTMMAGLLVGAGVGVLVLLRVNENRVENFKIIGTLYGIGVLCGIFLNAI